MLTIAVASLKGGTGKTTLAVLLAEAAVAAHGSALLIDADPQSSAMSWSSLAAGADNPLGSVVVSLPTADLGRRLPAIAGTYPVAVIDTPPGLLPIVTAAIRAADVLAVPVQPSVADVDRVWTTLDLAASLGRPAVAVLSRTRTGTRALAAARAALAAGATVSAVELPQREAIAATYGRRPAARLVEPLGALLTELTTTTGESR